MNLLDALITLREAALCAPPHPTVLSAIGRIDVRIHDLQAQRARLWHDALRSQTPRDGILDPKWIDWHRAVAKGGMQIGEARNEVSA